MFLKNLQKISEDYIGAIEGTLPFICKQVGDCTLKEIVNGTTKNYLWRSVSVEEAEHQNPICIMYVKYINANNSRFSAYNVNLIRSLSSLINKTESTPVLWCSISGVMVENILFLKSRHKVSSQMHFDIRTSEEVYVKQLDTTFNDVIIRGRYDLSTCSYYCS